MTPLPRLKQFQESFPKAPSFRLKQLEEALFSPTFSSFDDISNLPLEMRETLSGSVPWLSVKPLHILESKKKDTFKAVIGLYDEKRVETVLMQNRRGHYTVCVSSQVGCAMACTFCATGKMGFGRNLSSDEIVDQYRFWLEFLRSRTELPQYISNIVFMGMGEPLANYENVKETLRLILLHTDIGPTRITVSTVGLLPMLRKLLDDPKWPAVRVAVSLHSADAKTRREIMPSSFDGFIDDLIKWTESYFEKFTSRRRHLTFEYVMLSGVNDTEHHAKALVRFARRVGKARINLIPYNFTGSVYTDSLPKDFQKFERILQDSGVTITRRRTMGDDIAAACGQLIVEKSKEKEAVQS